MYEIDQALLNYSIAQREYVSGVPTPFYVLTIKQSDTRYEIRLIEEEKLVANKLVEGPLREAKIQGIQMLYQKYPMMKREDFTMVHFKEDRERQWQKETHPEVTELFNRLASSSISIRVILQKIMTSYLSQKKEPFGNNDFGQYVRRQVPAELKQLKFVEKHIKVQASVGQGVWATVPWIALMDTRLTDSTQKEVYVVYLFAEDMQSVYLTLNQGVTEPLKKGRVEGYRYLREQVQEIRTIIPLEEMFKDENIQLGSGGLGKNYEVSTVAYYRYELNRLPSDVQLYADLANVMDNYEQFVEHELEQRHEEEMTMQNSLLTDTAEEPAMVEMPVSERITAIKDYICSKGFSYPDNLIENMYLSLKSKPFVILAGVSGTGKTKLVQLFAEAIGASKENGRYELIPVRPDWSDPSDLIGYKDLSQQFRPGPLTKVLIQASLPGNRHKPYFICLDEMNLARVEHYFSDLLSLLETQKWSGDEIITHELISESSLVLPEDQELYAGLHIPDNVYLIGTVNMDETTHPFSKKVLDRANTIEFNYIELNQLPDLALSGNQAAPEPTLAPNSFLRTDYLQLTDVYKTGSPHIQLVQETTDELVKVNSILESIHSHVGFRIRDAVCFYAAYSADANLLSREQAMDLQLLQKILPRIQGSQESVRFVLLQLLQIALNRTINLAELSEDPSSLWRDVNETISSGKYKLSARKIIFMLRRLDEDGFTSFWLS
ncbi:McrB family protein [Paenibacillus sp. D51F]